jgi:signal transduction histidine kinase
MAGPGNLDGLIVLSNTIGNFETPENVARLVAGSSLPSVSIQVALAGMPCVSAESEPALKELVHHLVADHGRRSFALITGPDNHPDSIRREAAFRAALAEDGIAFDEALRARGNFLAESGAEAVRALLSSTLHFDAVVCLNDAMALRAIGTLKENGIAVPSEVSVTGFDDIFEAAWSSPELTTVAQPREDLGRLAVDMILEELEGRSPPTRRLECHSVYRRSCGCLPVLSLGGAQLGPATFSAQDRRRFDLLRSRAKAGDIRGLLEDIDAELSLADYSPESLDGWRRLVYSARSALPSSSGFSWADQALDFLRKIELRREVSRGLELSHRYTEVRGLIIRLLGTFSFDALVKQWEICLGSMGISRGFLVLFERPVFYPGPLPPRSRLVAMIPEMALVEPKRWFPTERIIPESVLAGNLEGSWIVEPLVYGEESLGYLLIECGSEDPTVYETLRAEMSTAVKATLLMEEIQANESNRTMQSIGQDIHDDLCQHLAGVSMLVAALEENLVKTGSVSVGSVREIGELVSSAMLSARQYARGLCPPTLEPLGLVSALEDLVAALGRTAGKTSISFQTEGDCAVADPGRALNLYRIVQEALSNALRHSGSEAVIVRLLRRGGRIVAEVRDFGSGLGAGACAGDDRGRGMGMRIMRYRAESIGAKLEILELDPGLCVSCELEEAEGA